MRITGPKHKTSDPGVWSKWLSSLSERDKISENVSRSSANDLKRQQRALLAEEGADDVSGQSADTGRTLSSFASLISIHPGGDDDLDGGGASSAPPAPTVRPQTPPAQISLSTIGSPSRWSPVTKMAFEIAKNPSAIKEFFSKKRSADVEDDDEDRARSSKKPRALRTTVGEIPSDPSVPACLGSFHEEIKILFWNNQYLPISIFTFEELNRFMESADDMPKKKLESKVRVIDLSAISLMNEHALSTGQWREAADNWLRFCAVVGADDFVQRWRDHFDWLIRQPYFEQRWPTFREMDIRLRRQYRTLPFAFNPMFYQMKFTEISELIRDGVIQVGQLAPAPSGRQGQSSRGAPAQAGGAQPVPAGRTRGGGAGPAQGRAPFRMGGGGDPSTSICLVCTRKGHMVPGCTAAQFAGGGQVFAEARNGSLFARGRDEEICRRWNAAGPNSCRQTDHPARRHICSFCGSGDHHAFSWSCKAKPN
ncbi:hypothetical protein NEOLEDRAFT_1182034 [Neolentinus lepideus HHB14362 ss-1]|uniref:CCHC-type domain-containing protein n=1 Tax=Neolentinus lepideus HHB14362 ss-1 TaxID=1314782 RepID=A0A165PJ64_9AGAM|nr:hypothetical protein NEOLEDRAFT_1182034 [Neolentinus lepideus HHB14362 ss-1]